MRKDLEILCQLQDLDDRIKKAKEEKVKLPKLINEFEGKFNAGQEAIKGINQSYEQNLRQQKRLELNIAKNNQEINKYESQLLLVKTNKEYKALNSEITHRKEENAQIEEQLIKLMEEEAALEKKQKNLKELLSQDKDILNIEKDKINQKIDKLNKEIAKYEQKKIEFSKKIPNFLFKKYQRLMEHKNGKAIASIENGICSGCHLRIRPQIIVEVYRDESIVTCENCSRILIPPKKSAKEN